MFSCNDTDDRPEYASIQAILYGPYLLSAHTTGDWDIKTGSASSPSDWITPIPSSYNDYLVTFTQQREKSIFALTNANQSIAMKQLPEPGTEASVQATFRLIFKDSPPSKLSSLNDIIGKSVVLEPFVYPGFAVVQQGEDNDLSVADSSSEKDASSVFRVASGLDGTSKTISLELQSKRGCFVYNVDNESGGSLKLSCNKESSDTAFSQAASFEMKKGLSEYHPISFVAKGASRNFLLAPLLSHRDETYTVYFNIHS